MATSAPTAGLAAPTTSPRAVSANRQLAWLAGGMALSFVVPFLLADQLELQRDVYYGVYAGTVVALFSGWARNTKQSLGEMCARRWKVAVALGGAFAAMEVVLARANERLQEAGEPPLPRTPAA